MKIYVFPDAGGWSVKRDRLSLAALSTHLRKEDAINFAQSLAHDSGVEVVVMEERRETPRKPAHAE